MVKNTKKQKSYLWDTGALFLYFADHFEAKALMKEIDSNQTTGYVPQLVLVEFYYKTKEKLRKHIAEYQLILLKESKNKIIRFNDDQISLMGSLKLRNRNLSIVDCVIGVLSIQYKATIITTDGDFDIIKEVKSVNLTY